MNTISKGEQAPDFTIKDFNGNQFKLSDFKNKKHVLLVLNRGLS